VAEDNVELVRAGLAAFSEGGVEALLAFVHPEFEMTTPPNLAAEPDTYRGHEGIRRYFDSFYDAMDEIRFEPGELFPVGEGVIVPLTLRARGRTTAIETEQQLVTTWRLRDGKAIRVEVHATLEEALAAGEEQAEGRLSAG
jgi:ketosteroid isomerase-like protein